MEFKLISKLQRVNLIETQLNFNDDLISICETSLNDSVELPEPLLNAYTFVPANRWWWSKQFL